MRKPTTGRDRISGRLGASMEGKAINRLRVTPVMVHETEQRWKSGPNGAGKHGPYVVSGAYIKPTDEDAPRHRSGRIRRRHRARWARTPESTARHLAPRVAVIRDI